MMTLKELSAAIGLSVSTVSKALNGYTDVSEETRLMVQRKAADLGYRPNAAARGLRSGRSYNIGVVYAVDDESGLTHNYFSPILEAFRSQVENRGYDLTFMSRRFGSDGASYTEHAKSRNFDGVCIVCCHFEEEEARELLQSDVPLVTIDYLYGEKSCISSDNRQGMELLMQNVIGKGHTRIAFVQGSGSAVSTIRRTAFNRMMQSAGIPIRPEYMVTGEFHNPSETRKAVKMLLELPEPPTCILMPDDYASLGGMDAIREKGLRIPEDISVVGFDGVPLMQRISPALTTVCQDTAAIGRNAADQLIALIESPDTTYPEVVSVPCTFLPGQTLQAPNKH